MDPIHLRPWDVRPDLDDNFRLQDDNLCYQRIFAARINNLLEARQNICKRVLLDELHRLRQIVVSADDNAKRCAHACVPNSRCVQSSCRCDSVSTGQLNEPASKSSSRTRATAVVEEALSDNQHPAERHGADYKPLFNSKPRVGQSALAPVGSPLFAEHRPCTELTLMPSWQTERTSNAIFRDASASTSSFLEINVEHVSALRNVVSTHHHIIELNKAYYSTLPPLFVTLSATEFSTTEQQHLFDTNKTLDLLHSNSQLLGALSDPFPALPNSPTLPFTDRFPAPFHSRRYLPPLLGRLFFERELALLFDSQLRYTYSAESVSLKEATGLYMRALYPTPRASSIFRTESDSSQVKSPKRSTAVHHHEVVEESSSLSSSVECHNLPHSAKTFQRRTFYRSMTPTTELRAPIAAWRDDKASLSLFYAPHNQSHHAYAVSSEVRGLPSYINLQGVHTGYDDTSVTLAFGFQRRTNYPFRKTYRQPRSVKAFATPMKTLPRLSPEFASRVPVTGLSSTLLHLFQPDVCRGLFFSHSQAELSLVLENVLERMPTKIIYSITAEGKLLREQAKESIWSLLE